MHNIPEEAVKAAATALANYIGHGMTEKCVDKAKEALTAALPFLPVQGVKVKALEWGKSSVSEQDKAQTVVGSYFISNHAIDAHNLMFDNDQITALLSVHTSLEAAKAAAQADYEARILSALEQSAARELALEEIIALCRDYGEDSQPDSEYRLACNDIIEAIQERRALSSPVHADAGKVEGDGIERTEFNRGYVLACANIVNLHGADVAVMEGFAQLGISKAELKALDLCEYDQRAIDALEDYFGADKLYRTSAPSEGAE